MAAFVTRLLVDDGLRAPGRVRRRCRQGAAARKAVLVRAMPVCGSSCGHRRGEGRQEYILPVVESCSLVRLCRVWAPATNACGTAYVPCPLFEVRSAAPICAGTATRMRERFTAKDECGGCSRHP